MGKFFKGIFIVNSMWMFACAMKKLFIDNDPVWELLFIIASMISCGNALVLGNEE